VSLTDSLCALPPSPPLGCCDPTPEAPATPIAIFNPPGLAALQYRIGTFTSFRRAMLDMVTRPHLICSASTSLRADVGARATDTTLSVSGFTQFPAALPYTVKIGTEYLLVTAGAGTTNWTVIRGVNNSSPAAHFVGDTVVLAIASPFVGWHEQTDADYQTIFIEFWAYLADVLTFYQERVANEAFILTATQRDSMLRLAELIDYHPSPGAGATTLVAFTVEKGKEITIPAHFRVGSRAQPGKPAAVFETSSAIIVRGDHNGIPLSAVAPTNQFAPLSSFGFIFAPSFSVLPELAQVSAVEHLYGSAGATYLRTLTLGSRTVEGTRAGLLAAALVRSAMGQPTTAGAQTVRFPTEVTRRTVYQPFVNTTKRTMVIKGVNNRLVVGDYVLAVENEAAPNSETPHLYQITTINPDKVSDTTTITWEESAGTTYDQTLREVALYALRVKAGPFGNNAPDWNSLPAALKDANASPPGPYPNSWDDANNAKSKVPGGNHVFLDATYDAIKGTPQFPGWVVLMADGNSRIFHVIDARPVSKADYTISAKVTRLTLGPNESVPANTFPLRETLILTGSERLTLQNNLPLPEPLAGSTLVLAGLYSQLQKGQTVILQGALWDATTQTPTAVANAEARVLDALPVLDTSNNLTTVTLNKSLDRQYVRASASLIANVIEATQGETVKDEVLGSSDGSAFQAYALKQKPLTYLPSTDPEGVAAVQSTLLVTVNGVRWNEQPTLVGSTPDAQAFTTTLDDLGQTTIVFGDGFAGAIPPSGRGNIRARYRKGLGNAGNVSVGAIQQLIDSLPSLQKVTNPQASHGGADQENIAQMRVHAPASMRTFGRAVSVEDHAALALRYPGIAKAGARWVLRDPTTLRAIPQPYIQLTVATSNQVPLAEQTVFVRQLRSFLDTRRDPNVPLRIIDFTPVYIDLAVTVDIDDRFPQQATLARVQAALYPGLNPDGSAGYFAFERLEFGQSIHLSTVYAVVQAVSGVRDAKITTLRRMDLDAADPSKVRDDIFVRPTEIVIMQNDPADPSNGRLSVTRGTGGFVDT
jgi:predicted phage baseplate assembly protein